jgi:release factor glutamine methyltransferase
MSESTRSALTNESSMTTVQEAASRLHAAGVASPMHDARVLLEYAAERSADLDTLLQARASRIPLQHIVGRAGFRYLDLQVGPGVFIPRPETELLVDAVLERLRSVPVTRAPRVVDLCAGSGAIGLAIANEHSTVTVDLVERSAQAMPWLRRNAAGHDRVDVHGVDRVRVHHADLADAPADAAGAVDVVVSNPPYVPIDERELVEPEVRDHDPAEALWAGPDGLEIIHRVVARAAELLRPDGLLVMEHSERQDQSVPGLLAAAGFADVVVHPDLTGRPRFVTASWLRHGGEQLSC